MLYLYMYKFISFIIKTTIVLFILLHIVVYALYRYQLKDIDVNIYKIKQHSYTADYYTVLWVNQKTQPSFMTANHRIKFRDIEIEPIYPIYDVMSYFFNKHYFPHPSRKISYSVVNNLSDLRHQHIKKYAIQMWISHHLTFEELSNLYFTAMYYGQKYTGIEHATKGYFDKKSNELNTYDVIMLVALTNAPTNLAPKRHPKKLLRKMNSLINKLKDTFPLYYKDLTYQTKLP